MTDKYEIMWDDCRLDAVIDEFVKGYSIKGKEIVSYTWYVDTAKNRVITQFVVKPKTTEVKDE